MIGSKHGERVEKLIRVIRILVGGRLDFPYCLIKGNGAKQDFLTIYRLLAWHSLTSRATHAGQRQSNASIAGGPAAPTTNQRSPWRDVVSIYTLRHLPTHTVTSEEGPCSVA